MSTNWEALKCRWMEALFLLDDLGLLAALPSADWIRRVEERKEATYKEKQD